MFTKDNIKTTLNKMITELDENPSVNSSFSLLWGLKWQIIDYHLQKNLNDLQISELQNLYNCYTKTDGHRYSYDNPRDATYDIIIAKMIEVYSQMFADKDFSKYEIKHSIQKTLLLVKYKINEEQLESLLDIYHALK